MGLCSSSEIKQPASPISRTPSPEPPPSDECDEQTGSDCLYISTDKAIETVKVENELGNYEAPKYENQENAIKKATNIPFFTEWLPTETSSEDAESVFSTPNASIDETQDKVSETLTQEDIDTKARQTPKRYLHSFQSLKEYLLQGLDNHIERERLTVRAIIVWLSAQNEEEFSYIEPTRETPEGFLSLLSRQQSLFCTFFTILCRKFGIHCVKIPGVSKAGDYQPGDHIDDYSDGDTWSAVYINRFWKIVHPYWVCKGLFGHNPGGWIKLEEGGKPVGTKEKQSAGVLRNAFREYYIFPNAEEFIHLCHPNDKKWQLTKDSISRKDFIEKPYVFPTFFGMGLKLNSEKKCLLESITGEALIEIQAPIKNANTIDLWYELYLKEGTGGIQEENRLLEPENIPRLVAMLRCGDVWKFRIIFPIEGTFKICCYGGPYKSNLSRIAEFRIDCKKSKHNCSLIPYNPGRVGFGPGPATEDAGFFVPSHSQGMVSVDVKKATEISFIVETTVFQTRSIIAQLHHINLESINLQQHVKIISLETQRKIVFRADVPEDGEYALIIHSFRKSKTEAFSNAAVSTERESINVCNYLLTTLVKQREKANQKNARNALRQVMSLAQETAGEQMKFTVINLQTEINNCIKQRISENDGEIVSAKSTLGFLILRNEARDAKLRRNQDVTLKTLKKIKRSTYHRIFEKDVNQLEELLRELEE